MKKILLLGLLIIILVVGFALLPEEQQQEVAFEAANSEPVKVGVLAPLSGDFADFGEESRRGILDIETDKVEFIFEDSACDPKKAISAFKKLTEIDGVQYIIGPGCGSPQEAVAPLVAQGQILNILGSAASRALHDDGGGRIYNTQYSLQDESTFIAQKMEDLGYEKVILVYYQNAFSETHRQTFNEQFDGEVVEVSFLDFNSDVSTEITKLKNTDAEAIFVADTSFFFAQGLAKLEQFEIDLPIFSMYTTEFSFVRPLAEGVKYSYSSLVGGQGSAYEFPKLAAEALVDAIVGCAGDHGCVLQKFEDSEQYDESGVLKQEIILKQIVGGEAVEI